MQGIAIKEITINSPEYQQVWQLREDVLRKPIGLSLKDEDLSSDAEDRILIAMYDDHAIGCVMLKDAGSNLKLRQMAVANAWQGKSTGRQLVQAAEKVAKENGYKKIVLHARQVAVGFYQKLGYEITSDLFTEVGIPHYVMEKAM